LAKEVFSASWRRWLVRRQRGIQLDCSAEAIDSHTRNRGFGLVQTVEGRAFTLADIDNAPLESGGAPVIRRGRNGQAPTEPPADDDPEPLQT